MDSETKHSTSFWLFLITATLLFDVAAIRASLLRANELGMDLLRSTWGGIVVLYLAISVACIVLFVYNARGGRRHVHVFSNLDLPIFQSAGWRTLSAILFVAWLLIIPFLKFALRVGQYIEDPTTDPLLLSYLFYWMCWWFILLAMLALKVARKTSWPVAFISVLTIAGVAYEIWIRFGLVTTYPLSMGWSEGSRYFYASLYFSRSLYGESLPLSTLHPTRYFLQSIPFLIPGLDITAHRFWQFLLWIGLTAGATISIARRAADEKAAQWLIAGGLFLILLRMGVYYHLEPMVILPMIFVSGKRPVRSLLAVLAASLWAGVSRVNWFPMPAMIATAIYLLETPLVENLSVPSWKRMASYLSLPALWVIVGLIAALISQAAYIPLSGNAANADAFASSLTSDLLWYRLWPNPNHQLGIVPATLLFTFPLLATLFIAARQLKSIHFLRWLGLFAMIAVLFAGSLVVSVKIGGGGDLHNMDTYAVMLSIVAAYFIGGRVVNDSGDRSEPIRLWSVLSIAALIPTMVILPLVHPHPTYNEDKNEQAHQALMQIVNNAGQSGPVLLINERQLAAFDDLDMPLVAEYEAVTLMEMAMSGNMTYLNRFYNDLRSHRFSVIITNPQNLTIKTDGSLKEENNVWNTRVAPYILCYYMPSQRIETDWNRIEVYVPNLDAKNCP